jgi:hypothetical protein
MEGDSRSLRQLHDSAANSSEDLELSLFRPSSLIGVEPRLILLLTSLNKHACTMKHLPNPEPTEIQFLQPPCLELKSSSRLHNTATKAAGVKSTYTFGRYVASLLDQAAVHDSASLAPEDAIQTRTQCQRHGVMLHDGMIEQDDHNGYETLMNVTSRLRLTKYGEHERYQQQNNPVAMDHASFVWIATWKSLTADQTAWDSVSEGKVRSDYNVKRANNSNSNSSFATTTSGMPNNARAGYRITNGGLEAKVHDVHIETRCCYT